MLDQYHSDWERPVARPQRKVTLLYVCFATKAIHIEVVTSLTTEAFLVALRRVISRRGKPRTIHSDNGTNYQGAGNEFHAVYKMLQSTSQMATIRDFVATER
jgi:transposase InsO family protein